MKKLMLLLLILSLLMPSSAMALRQESLVEKAPSNLTGLEETLKLPTIEDWVPAINVWLDALTNERQRSLTREDRLFFRASVTPNDTHVYFRSLFTVITANINQPLLETKWQDIVGMNESGGLAREKIFILDRQIAGPIVLRDLLIDSLIQYKEDFNPSYLQRIADHNLDLKKLLKAEFSRFFDAVFPGYQLSQETGANNSYLSQAEIAAKESWDKFNAAEERLLKTQRRAPSVRRNYLLALTALKRTTRAAPIMWRDYSQARQRYLRTNTPANRNRYWRLKSWLVLQPNLSLTGLEESKPDGMETTIRVALDSFALAQLPENLTLWVDPTLKDAIPAATWGVRVEVLPENISEARTLLRERAQPGDLVLLDRQTYSLDRHRVWKAMLSETNRQGLWIRPQDLSDRDAFAVTIEILRNSGEILPALGPDTETRDTRYRLLFA